MSSFPPSQSFPRTSPKRKNVPLGALLIQNTRTALLATDRCALLERHADRAVAASVPHDAAATAVAVIVGGAGGEALGVGDLVLLAGRHLDCLCCVGGSVVFVDWVYLSSGLLGWMAVMQRVRLSLCVEATTNVMRCIAICDDDVVRLMMLMMGMITGGVVCDKRDGALPSDTGEFNWTRTTKGKKRRDAEAESSRL